MLQSRFMDANTGHALHTPITYEYTCDANQPTRAKQESMPRRKSMAKKRALHTWGLLGMFTTASGKTAEAGGRQLQTRTKMRVRVAL